MAKIIYAYSRKAPFGTADIGRLKKICARLEPDNLSLPVQHTVAVHGALACGIVNDRNAVVRGDNVLLGCLYGKQQRWEDAGAEPDGSFAIFRDGRDFLEVVSDAAASRTVWYCMTDDVFVASTSQRAIVMFLGTMDFDERVIPWMLSTGSLGPALSWDKRINRLPPDSLLRVDKLRWAITVDTKPIAFSACRGTRADHKHVLESDIRGVIQSMHDSTHIDFRRYILPLSGGYDSRAILCFLSGQGAPEDLKAITWGLEKNIERDGNDAAVAKALASKMGVPHKYFHTDFGEENVARIIDRFIRCGEGRVDHLSGYMDGLEIWRRLLEDENASGIIRGDEGFGWTPVSSELTVRFNVGMALCADYANLQDILRRFKLPQQELPDGLRRMKHETLETWRDRLYHAYRLPTILAALSDIKYSYVEIINPLLARSLLYRVRTLPDGLRTDKTLFKEIVNTLCPDVPIAREGANASPGSILRRREVAELMKTEILSEKAAGVLGRDLLEHVAKGIRTEGNAAGEPRGKGWSTLKSFIPRSIKNRVRDLVAKPQVDGNILAFRVFLILRMHDLLKSDCEHMKGSQHEIGREMPVS